ncbi:transposase [Gramella lutea]|uniref:Transposase n=1 Tax=Christiangramia lutea TaxID=1607951 RepID=A0A9X2A9H6_9FLAO|nr:transposase [Christiangramia lutea]MCH4822131.1 transposase [Christiangramia lutea]
MMQCEPIKTDSYYHIFNRGNNKQLVFFEERNYHHFLRLTEKYLLPVCDIYAYCMLPNHFHLLIRTKNDIENRSISQAFSNFFNSYAKAINKAYNRTGSLFQDRFKRKRIEDEKYLQNLILYIHRNPENHKVISNFREYQFSSFSKLVSDSSTFLQRDQVIDLFDSIDNFDYLHSQTEVESKWDLNFD